jgi:hypothetical protein
MENQLCVNYNKSESPLPRDHPCQIWFNLVKNYVKTIQTDEGHQVLATAQTTLCIR